MPADAVTVSYSRIIPEKAQSELMTNLSMKIHPKLWTVSVCAVAIACGMGVRASAATIAVTYSEIGGSAGPMAVMGTTLTFDSLLTLSVLSGDPNLNAIWNPVISSDHNVVDLTTALLNATVTWTFADGSTLSGTLFEDVQAFITGAGPFTSKYTFTGGTGEFAGATGSLSGGGVVGAHAVPASGSGTLNTPAIPEPASITLAGLGIAVMAVCRRRRPVVREE